MLTGVFPESLKQVTIVPVYKKGNIHSPSNYRPITLINTIGKIFDKFLHKRLFDFISNYSALLSENQHGFRPQHSTMTILNKLIQRVRDALHSKNMYAFLTFDLSKAFDSVPIKLLLLKLERMGIRGVTLNIFQTYLENRPQQVKFSGSYSNFLNGIRGVPQGSSLGPLLYLAFSNDLCELKNISDMYAYADDSGLGQTVGNLKLDMDVLRNSANTFTEWVKANGLEINEEKTELIIFCSHLSDDYKNTCHVAITINNKQIRTKSCIKYLGLKIDDALQWKNHISEVNNKLRRYVPISHRFKSYLPFHLLKLFYKAYIEPHIRYGIDVWGSVPKSSLLHIQRTQNIIARALCTADGKSPAVSSFTKLEVLSCYALNIWSIYTTQWRNIYVYGCQDTRPIPLSTRTGITTRGATENLFRIPKYYTNYGKFDQKTRLPIILNFLLTIEKSLYLDWQGIRSNPSSKLLNRTLQGLSVTELQHLF